MHFEPTCLALLALSAEAQQYGAAIAAGLQALERNAAGDGSYRLARGRAEATWPTALVLFTKAALGRDNLDPSAGRLLRLRGQVMKSDPEVADMMDINVELIGWPWAQGNFSWVEPTAWACLALRRAGRGAAPEVAEGLRLLLDRAFEEGGINYGNRKVLGKMTEPIPTPTALMLLALQKTGAHPRLAPALLYLIRQSDQGADLEHVAWTKLALSVYAEQFPGPDMAERIRKRIEELISAEDDKIPTVRLALALLALDSDRHNPFELSSLPLPEKENIARASVPEVPPNGEPLLERVKSRFRGVVANGLAGLRPLPANSSVHIAHAPDYEGDLTSTLRQQYAHFRNEVPLTGKRVVLKPNLVEYHRDKVINTNPRVIEAVIELCRAEGAAEVVVGEGPGHWRNVGFLVEESGLGAVLRKQDVRFVDLNHDEPVKALNIGRLTKLDYLYVAQTCVNADVFISMPKMKTHHWAGATLSLKNLFGIVPGICYGWPKNELHWRGIPNSIIDIALTCTPHLAIVDGIIGMEGDGPLNGTAKPMGVLVMGADLLAVDATCCRLMGLDPRRLVYLMLGEKRKLGRLREEEIPQLGESIAARAQTFALPPKIEKHLA
jgi:uncharacterized protein (DUF362 family)